MRCIHTEGSGCYGHNGADDVAVDAALLARALPGRPGAAAMDARRRVQVGAIRRRHGDARQGRARRRQDRRLGIRVVEQHPLDPSDSTAGTNVLAALVSRRAAEWAPPQSIPQPAGGGDRNAVPLYEFASQRVASHFLRAMPLRVSALRHVGAYGNVFAIESFVDELAAAANADPVAFRLAHLKDERARAVIEAAAKAAGWQAGGAGRTGVHGRGFGFARYKNSAAYVAVVAKVAVDRASGKLRVTQVHAAVDAGQIVNPDGLKNQIEGGIVQSVTAHAEQVRLRQERHPGARLRQLSDPDHAGCAEGSDRADQLVAERAAAPRRLARRRSPRSNAFADATGKRSARRRSPARSRLRWPDRRPIVYQNAAVHEGPRRKPWPYSSLYEVAGG